MIGPFLALLIAGTAIGCRAQDAAEEAEQPSHAAPPPAPEVPGPDSTKAVEQPVSPPPPEYAAPSPRIPREAFAHRDNFIRIWRFYFGLAESPTIGFAQVHQESRWKATAQSKYASGMAQFTPPTAADYAPLLPPEVRAKCPSRAGCPTDPNWALHALSLYDFKLHKRYTWAATPDDRWRLALAAYNGGAGWISKERVRANNSTRWRDIADACMRKAEFCKENRDYPVVILEKWLPLYQAWLGL